MRGSHGNKEGVPGRGYSLGKSRQRGARLVCLRSCRKAPVPLPTPILFSGTVDATPLTTEPDIQARHSPSLHCRQPCPYCFLCQPSLCTRHLLQGASRDLFLPSQGCCMVLLAKLNPRHSLTARGTAQSIKGPDKSCNGEAWLLLYSLAFPFLYLTPETLGTFIIT